MIPAEGYFPMPPAADQADDLLLTLSFTYTFSQIPPDARRTFSVKIPYKTCRLLSFSKICSSGTFRHFCVSGRDAGVRAVSGG